MGIVCESLGNGGPLDGVRLTAPVTWFGDTQLDLEGRYIWQDEDGWTWKLLGEITYVPPPNIQKREYTHRDDIPMCKGKIKDGSPCMRRLTAKVGDEYCANHSSSRVRCPETSSSGVPCTMPPMLGKKLCRIHHERSQNAA